MQLLCRGESRCFANARGIEVHADYLGVVFVKGSDCRRDAPQ
jgi:hypothetical protein